MYKPYHWLLGPNQKTTCVVHVDDDDEDGDDEEDGDDDGDGDEDEDDDDDDEDDDDDTKATHAAVWSPWRSGFLVLPTPIGQRL